MKEGAGRKMSFTKRVQIYLDNPWRVFYKLNKKRISHLIPDSFMLKIMFHARMGKALNLKNPETFNEKIQWLKLHEHYPRYTQLVDKFEVRKYIADKIGEQYLVPLLGVWDDVEDIDFESLPNAFVLKCTHDSGSVIVCTDKEHFDVTMAKEKLSKAKHTNFYWLYREWPYKNVKPRIIAEQYIGNNIEKENNEIQDYKIHCFDGIPRFILVCGKRFSETGLEEDFFDTEWKHMPLRRPNHQNSLSSIDMPDGLNEMLDLARILSKGMPFIRVDFYEVDNKVYFGELTLYPASGFGEFDPEKYDQLFGSWIQL